MLRCRIITFDTVRHCAVSDAVQMLSQARVCLILGCLVTQGLLHATVLAPLCSQYRCVLFNA